MDMYLGPNSRFGNYFPCIANGYSKEINKTARNCRKCGLIHGFFCPAYREQCRRCHRFGHYARMCFTEVNQKKKKHKSQKKRERDQKRLSEFKKSKALINEMPFANINSIQDCVESDSCLRAEVSGLKRNVKEGYTKLSCVKTQLQKAKDKVKELEIALTEKDREIQALKTELNTVMLDLKSKEPTEKVEDLKKKIMSLEMLNKNLTEVNEFSNAGNIALIHKNTALEVKISQLEFDNDNHHDKFIKLKNKLKDDHGLCFKEMNNWIPLNGTLKYETDFIFSKTEASRSGQPSSNRSRDSYKHFKSGYSHSKKSGSRR